MTQSGKIVAYVCTALSAAAMLGVSILDHRRAMDRPRPVIGTVRAGQDISRGRSEALAEVRALAATVSGAPSETPQAGTRREPSRLAAPPPEWTPVEVGAALMQCVSLRSAISAEVIPLAPVRYNDCGTPAPVLLRSIGGKDRIAVDPPLVMNCPMVAALSRWMEKTVQPAARATFGSPVARIVGSSYACRNLYNLPNERRSQHAYANAIDLPAFFLANGRKVESDPRLGSDTPRSRGRGKARADRVQDAGRHRWRGDDGRHEDQRRMVAPAKRRW